MPSVSTSCSFLYVAYSTVDLSPLLTPCRFLDGPWRRRSSLGAFPPPTLVSFAALTHTRRTQINEKLDRSNFIQGSVLLGEYLTEVANFA